MYFIFFFFNDTATTEIYTLSLHDALPILIPFLTISPTNRISPMNDETLSAVRVTRRSAIAPTNERGAARSTTRGSTKEDRKSTRLNSSHSQISYAVFCLKKKKDK